MVRAIEVNAKRPGSAAALIRALDATNGAGERIRVELDLTYGEIGRILAGLSGEQKRAFAQAGLCAALLA